MNLFVWPQRYLVFILMIATALSGCDLISPRPAGPTQIPAEAYTQAAQTIIAQLTQSAPTLTPMPTSLPTTWTPTPESIVLPTSTGTPQITDTPPPTDTPTPLSFPETLYEDDFSIDTGWHKDRGENFGFDYAKSGYRIYVNIPFAPIWSIRERVFGDVRLEVDASLSEGPENGYYGLVCRHSDEGNYYALVIGSNGAFGIAKSEEGEFGFLQESSDQVGVIHPGKAINRVRADCIGKRLSLFANGQKLLELEDDDFEVGWVGLIAGTRSEAGLVVLFDNFAVIKP